MANSEKCVCCGAVIPEGRQVCPNCEAKRVVLKPCPFCGGKAKIVTNGEIPKSKYYFVDVLCEDMNCRGCSSCLEYKTKRQAISAWNRRAEDGK